ncbi:MAG TPA: OadG family protein [Spirochaetota bacterium]|nr:OadG family protein [Spirochaetota bacterium]HOL56386.1 OadG family protein [Spirochaetota bacterium]HPP04626.1 OadG family protein [Spirochaetota bacterium]
MLDPTFKLLSEAFVVMIMGMGVVFSFLIVLIIFISISGFIIRVFKLEKEEKVEIIQKSDDTQVIAAIVAAIKSRVK